MHSLDRLQLVTWYKNAEKAASDRRNGINNKHSKAVIGINKTTGKEFEFHSTREAERKTGTCHSDISKCCHGNKKSAGGYFWNFN